MKMGTFGKSARFHVPKNGTSDAETKKRRPLLNANIPSKWCVARSCYGIITFGWVFGQFLKIANVDRFYAVFTF